MIIQLMKLSDMTPADYHPRKEQKPGDSLFESVRKSIQEFGHIIPIVWNRRTGNIVGGHQTRLVLMSMGIEDADVSVVDLPLAKEKILNIALNKIGSDPKLWDIPKLKENPMAVPAENFNLKAMRYPCANGVIDLRTGKLHPGKPEDYFSLGSRIDFIGVDDPPELWERTLLEIYNGDQSIVDYLQRLFGYGLTGLSHLKVFPIFYGKNGWNGRSVILETIKNIMGTMAGPIPSEMLLSQKFAKSASGPSPDVMKLKGLRFAIASETDQNQRFSTSKIKWFTGRNEPTGRWPNDKRNVDFMPMFLMVLESNFKPSAPPRDYSFWERVHLIPHNITYVDREPRETYERRANGDLKEQLEVEYPKILGWLVKGCLLWQKHGLNPPDTILDESKKYRQGEGIIGDYIAERCIKEPFAKVTASDLYNDFVEWYHANHGEMEPTSTTFGKEISKEFEKRKTSGRIVYHGLRLNSMISTVSEG